MTREGQRQGDRGGPSHRATPDGDERTPGLLLRSPRPRAHEAVAMPFVLGPQRPWFSTCTGTGAVSSLEHLQPGADCTPGARPGGPPPPSPLPQALPRSGHQPGGLTGAQILGGEVVENLSRAATTTPPTNQAQAAGPSKSPTQKHRRIQKPHVWACRPETEGRVSGGVRTHGQASTAPTAERWTRPKHPSTDEHGGQRGPCTRQNPI